MPLTDTQRPLVIRELNTAVLCGVVEVLRAERSSIKAAIRAQQQHQLDVLASDRRRSSRDEAVGVRQGSAGSDSRKPPSTNSGSVDLVVVGTVVRALQSDVQERLVYRVQLLIRDDILGFDPRPEHLDYPNVLLNRKDGDEQSVEFPPLKTTLDLLSRLYQVIRSVR
jgi:hypothetical protein